MAARAGGEPRARSCAEYLASRGRAWHRSGLEILQSTHSSEGTEWSGVTPADQGRERTEKAVPSFPKTRRRRWRAALGVAIILSALYFARVPILAGLARLWIVDEPVAPAQAIVVLGGNPSGRGAAAAALYKQGAAPLVLISSPELTAVQKLRLQSTDADLTRQFLVAQGVPASAIENFGTELTSTRDEAMSLRDWCTRHPAARLIVPTDLFHTRRADWFIEKALAGTGTDVRVTAVAPLRYTAQNWWRHEDGLIAFETEVIKFTWYWFHY